MALEPYDVLIPGNYYCDIIFSGIPGFPALGTELFTDALTVVPGGIMNTVTGLTRLGTRVGWLGTLGNDFFSDFIAKTAHTEGIDLSLIEFIDHPFKRVTVSLSYPNDRAFITYRDTAPELLPKIYDALKQATFKHLHFTGLLIDEYVPELLDTCHSKNIMISMDCQYREQTLELPLVKAILSRLDMFMPNAAEAQRLTKTESLEDAASILREIVPHLIIKDGVNGAHSWKQDVYVHAPALRANPVDTTGAGDIFNAGFLAAHFQGKSTDDCLHWGNIAGALSLRGYGGCSTAPTKAELLAHL